MTRIINSGSTKDHLQEIAIHIYNICIQNNIRLYPSWIPRDQNKKADAISKELDTDNWSIDNETFFYIKSIYGNFTVDRFADHVNNKVKTFNSKLYCPGTDSVNAFSCNWENDFNWLCPPIHLISKTIQHLKNCSAKGVLFVPFWPSSYYWPLLTSDGKNFKDFVKHFIMLDPYFVNYSDKKCIFEGFTSFYSMALLLDFSTRHIFTT